ncbi:MAG: SGNH/GDSL hydrolase family protein [Nitrospiraceae bacterium]|nr:SGNH/GDSL hydrolase family protein [Nitrospiraceae bacterium]
MPQVADVGPPAGQASLFRSAVHKTLWLILLLVIELTVLLAVGEWVSSYFLPPGHHYLHPQPIMDPHATRMFQYRAHQHAFTIDKPFVTNALAFRDEREVPAPSSEDLRILAVGDSMTAGIGVSTEQTYVRQLESLLRPQAGPVRVMNAGVGGYGTWQELDLLNEKLDLVKPQIVTLQVYWNDLYTKPATVTPIVGGKNGESEDAVHEYSRVFKRSRVLLFLRERWASLSNRFSPSVDWTHREHIYNGVDTPYVAKAYSEMEGHLREFATLQARGMVPIVVILPMPMQVQQPTQPPVHMQERVQAMAARAGLRTVDLLPALRQAYAANSNLYIAWDNEHFTPAGHQIVAETLQRYFSQEHVLTSRNGN